jgi:hypothetical protein
MTRRVYTTEAERLAAERDALRDAARTGHYQAPVSTQQAEAYQRRYTPALGVRRAELPAAPAPAVTPAEVDTIVREAMGCASATIAQGQVSRELQARGATSDQVSTAMRRVGEAVARSDVGNLAASYRAWKEREAAEQLQRLRRGPFGGGSVPR